MQPRIVLVTGGTGTLGSAVVRALTGAAAGTWRVVANYLHDETGAKALREATGAEVRCADVSREAEVAVLFAGLPPLFAVVHTAAIARDAMLLRQTPRDWAATLQVNATGAFLVTRAALEALQPGGRLILFSSRVGEHGNAGQCAYAASKAAVIALARCAAREGAARRLAVNVVCPGFVPSKLSESLGPARQESLRQQSLLDTYAAAVQVAATVQWLLSDAAATITGQVLHCDSRI